jgi:hypothetical protein
MGTFARYVSHRTRPTGVRAPRPRHEQCLSRTQGSHPTAHTGPWLLLRPGGLPRTRTSPLRRQDTWTGSVLLLRRLDEQRAGDGWTAGVESLPVQRGPEPVGTLAVREQSTVRVPIREALHHPATYVPFPSRGGHLDELDLQALVADLGHVRVGRVDTTGGLPARCAPPRRRSPAPGRTTGSST